MLAEWGNESEIVSAVVVSPWRVFVYVRKFGGPFELSAEVRL